MRKIIWISGLILILVYINWIRDGFAQTLTDQMEAYRELVKLQHDNPSPQSGDYHTPPIYNDDEQSVSDSTLARHQRAGAAGTPEKVNHSSNPADSQLVLPDNNAVGRFGANLFSAPHAGDINPTLVPEEYLLGPGDNIIVSLWGRVQQEWNLTVDREGKIFIPKVGEIPAWGMTLDEFTRHLDAKLSTVYTGFKRRVTLGKIRTIKVFVYGEVVSPGAYTVSALSTLFNALYMAGGPSANGSFRQIKLIRDQKSTTIDLYEFLVKGDKTCDRPLLSGDVVFVPLAGPQATIRGEVKRPAIYEMLGGETVADLIDLAGGPTADAYLGRLMLDRVSDNDAREVIDLDFSGDDRQNLLLVDGDDLSVFSIYQMRHNIVWINGMVKHPGTFERTDSMCISDLIEKGQVLPNGVYMDRADLYRHRRDGRTEIIAVNLAAVLRGDADADAMLCDLDSLYIYSADEVERQRYVYVDGMVQNPGQYPLYENMTVSDLIFLAGNLKESAYMLQAELARIDSAGETCLLHVPLNPARPQDNIRLQENDRLFVRRIPGYQLHRMVTIDGEVQFPGRYSLTQNRETLWRLIGRAGGFTDKAFPIGTVFKRKTIADDLERKDIKDILARSQPLVADSTGILKPMPTDEFLMGNTDRIIIDMDRLISTNGAEGDFALQTGDYIYVPEVPTGIPVLGEVCANGTIKYQQGKKVNYYLDQAGGFTKRADKGEIRLIKANGRVYSSGNVKGRRVDLGDVVVVPAEIKKERDWLKYITASLSVLTGVATTVLIVDRL
jgi:protein involved in polysaccharide export with SLBB domain